MFESASVTKGSREPGWSTPFAASLEKQGGEHGISVTEEATGRFLSRGKREESSLTVFGPRGMQVIQSGDRDKDGVSISVER